MSAPELEHLFCLIEVNRTNHVYGEVAAEKRFRHFCVLDLLTFQWVTRP